MNALQNESSLYLQQHKSNPVNWLPWGNEAFEIAKNEEKLVLISIGYSACHWCHVMEHEAFEDQEVADLMNKYFICIKVDREERPDVDQVYMSAVQLMTQQGGWPLNCFTLPNGKPIFGGTYFPKDRWIHTLNSLQHIFTNDLPKVEEYAQQLAEGVQRSELIKETVTVSDFGEELLHELTLRWSKRFDNLEGGANGAPKFMLPNNYEYLMAYAQVYKNLAIEKHVDLTLKKMMLGGIYDQTGGGFSRYSVDILWKVPHFEKMLYDNAQMLSLYALAFKRSKKSDYRRVLEETIRFLEKELLHDTGAFYSALDADSEGEEGRFYVFNDGDLNASCYNKDHSSFIEGTFHLDEKGNWEYNNYILMRRDYDQETAIKLGFSHGEFLNHLENARDRFAFIRDGRERPGTDKKCLTSWNGMTIKGLCDAFDATNEDHYLNLAKRCALWILKYQKKEDGSLFHTYYEETNGRIDGFLEDYAHSISGFLALFQSTNESFYLENAKLWIEYCHLHFECKTTQLFFSTKENNNLIARKMEFNDNVIPSSNSTMAHNLMKIGMLLKNERYCLQAKQMLSNVSDGMEHYGSGYSSWALLWLQIQQGETTLKVKGNNSIDAHHNIRAIYLPQLVCTSEIEGKNDGFLVEVCKNNVCHLPVSSIEEAKVLL
jgi:uncharacterized protein